MSSAIATATGAIMVASWVNPTLFAIELMLVYKYYVRFPRDFLPYKLAVLASVTIECGTIMSVMAAAWMYSIKHWGDATYAASQPWPISFYVSSTAVTAIICQTFLSYRVYKFTQNIWYMPILALPSLASLTGAITTSYIVVGAGLADRDNVTRWVTLWLSGKLAADVMIAACQVWTLRAVKAQFEDSRNIIRRLSIQAIETGSVTAAYATVAIIVYELYADTNLSPMLGMMMGRVYTITLLINLLSRSQRSDDTHSSYPSGGRTNVTDHYGGKSGAGSRGGVNVATTTMMYSEEATVFEPAQPAALIYRTKPVANTDSDAHGTWERHVPGSEIDLNRAPLEHR